MADNTARLACFDALAPQLKAAQAAPSAPEPQPPADNRPWYDPGRIFGTSPSQQTTPEQFGSENLAPPAPPPPKPGEPRSAGAAASARQHHGEGDATMRYNPYGRIRVFLDNGQIWQQLEGDTDRAHLQEAVAIRS